MEERINAVRLTDNDTGKVYELDFNRESVRFAESRGFKLDDLTDFPVIRIPEFFYYAFRKNHKNMARSKTDALLEALGGMTPALVERLSQLYAQAGYSHLINDGEDEGKNGRVTLEL